MFFFQCGCYVAMGLQANLYLFVLVTQVCLLVLLWNSLESTPDTSIFSLGWVGQGEVSHDRLIDPLLVVSLTKLLPSFYLFYGRPGHSHK